MGKSHRAARIESNHESVFLTTARLLVDDGIMAISECGARANLAESLESQFKFDARNNQLLLHERMNDKTSLRERKG